MDKTMQNRPLDPAKWLDSHGDYLYRYALVRVRDNAAAEDLVQETLLAAIRCCDQHEGRSSERTWLAGVMKHKICDYFRRLARTSEFQLVDDEIQELEAFEKNGLWQGHWRKDCAPGNWSWDAVKLLESNEFREVFDRCLARLPRKMAIAFMLRELDGLSTTEICDLLNVSANNLWVILHRGRARLRQLLDEEWFGGYQPTPPADNDKTRRRALKTASASDLLYRAEAA